MTEKVCISRGFRLCFRDVLKGMPYTQEEAEIMREVKEDRPLVAEPMERIETTATIDIVPEEEGDMELEKVRSECNELRKQCAKIFSDDELTSMTAQILKYKDSANDLKKVYAEWQNLQLARIKKL